MTVLPATITPPETPPELLLTCRLPPTEPDPATQEAELLLHVKLPLMVVGKAGCIGGGRRHSRKPHADGRERGGGETFPGERFAGELFHVLLPFDGAPAPVAPTSSWTNSLKSLKSCQ
jgi:hypothetical protein